MLTVNAPGPWFPHSLVTHRAPVPPRSVKSPSHQGPNSSVFCQITGATVSVLAGKSDHYISCQLIRASSPKLHVNSLDPASCDSMNALEPQFLCSLKNLRLPVPTFPPVPKLHLNLQLLWKICYTNV